MDEFAPAVTGRVDVWFVDFTRAMIRRRTVASVSLL